MTRKHRSRNKAAALLAEVKRRANHPGEIARRDTERQDRADHEQKMRETFERLPRADERRKVAAELIAEADRMRHDPESGAGRWLAAGIFEAAAQFVLKSIEPEDELALAVHDGHAHQSGKDVHCAHCGEPWPCLPAIASHNATVQLRLGRRSGDVMLTDDGHLSTT